MPKKPKSPKELVRKVTKETVAYTIDSNIVQTIKEMAAKDGASASALAEEALRHYIETMLEKK